ncbi:GHKL domain-containing protein [Panacibacter ginsenosidivorans]|uniref:GHKL domain-containing protein n=1 Tax=Panacibacter ginsenosidivorans TaxID=1813871 RepID=A0A5B8V7E2_9BACT|nr:histidine kinase [Panacibacter ginsenosidivorans]QEC66701.1 GHKL domain-containing protein [Panacibacter ginsenosidivorans]
MKVAWYSKKWIIVVLHMLSWLFIFALPFLIRTNSNDQHRPGPEEGFLYFYIVTRFLWVGFFYLNAHYLFKKFLNRKSYWLYIISQFLVLFIISILSNLCFNIFVKDSVYDVANFLVYNIFTYFFILAASTAYKVVLDKIKSDKLSRERENENLKTELSFLRSQVSPHFMFNVLNNMVALARKQSDQLEPSLIKLSSLMRYMLYETDDDKVLLEKEVEYVKSYIDLQQLRFGKNVKVNVNIQNVDGGHEIEPMLLIPFVENAFKHGTGLIECAQIDIEMSVKNNILYFSARNKYNEQSNEVKDKTSGIGLTNVKRRLNLLYGNNHSLLINRKDNWFTVSLQLNLH